VRRLRRHLGGCAACRAYLRAYDGETRRLLAGAPAAASAGQRAARAFARIEELPAGLPAPGVARAGDFWRRVSGFLPAAAAILLAALLLHLVVFSNRTDDDPAAGSRLRAARAAAASWRREERRLPPLADMRWVLADDLLWRDGPRRRRIASERAAVLYGGRAAEQFTVVLKVEVDDGRSAARERLLLVAEELLPGPGTVDRDTGEQPATSPAFARSSLPPATWVDLLEVAEVDRSAPVVVSRGYRLVVVRGSPALRRRTLPQSPCGRGRLPWHRVSSQPSYADPHPSPSPTWAVLGAPPPGPILRR
jgi:hypothetical protein